MKRVFALPIDSDKARTKAATKHIKALEGARRVHVKTKKKLLYVTYDETRLSSENIEAELRSIGIDAHPIGERGNGSDNIKYALIWIITLFMLYLTLASRVVMPIPEVFSYPLSAGITQLVLLLLVQALSFLAARPKQTRDTKRGSDTYMFAALASACATLYSIPALIYAAWKISAGQSVSIELFFDSAALLLALLTLGMAAQKRAQRKTETILRELGLPYDNIKRLGAEDTKKAKFAVKLSRAFTIIALIIAAAAVIIWLAAGGETLSFAVKCAVCVLAVSCPGIPAKITPALIAQGVAACAKNGAALSDATVLERLNEVDTVIFESHDALTRSEAVVRGCVLTKGMSRNMLIALAASALQSEEDGVSRAIVECAELNNLPLDPLIEKDVNEDSDVRALVGDTRVLVGSYDFLMKNALDLSLWERHVDEITNEGLICVMVASAGSVQGIITLESKLLPRVCETMQQLRKMQIETYVMATENTKAARVLSLQVGADKSVYPQDAEIAIRLLSADKRKTLYVYGGETPVFDVPGLKMNLSANPLADAQIRGQLGDLPFVIQIARRTFSSIGHRIRLWLLYEILVLPTAAGALHIWPGFTISPLIAAPLMLIMNLVMMGSGGIRRFARRPKALTGMVAADISANEISEADSDDEDAE